MDERDYKAMNATETTRNKVGFRIALCLLLIGIATTIHCVCNKVQEVETVNKTDSLTTINKALEVQLGYALAEAQTQATRAVKAETAAKQRDTIYVTRTKWIKSIAPDTCQPYLDAIQNECDTLVLMHVNSEMSKDALIEKQNGVISIALEKDSVSQLVIGEQRIDLKKSAKELRKQRNGKRAAIGFGLGMLVLYVISGVVN